MMNGRVILDLALYLRTEGNCNAVEEEIECLVSPSGKNQNHCRDNFNNEV